MTPLWTALSDRRMLITVNTVSVAINLVALVVNAWARQWAFVSLTSVVLLVITAGVMMGRMMTDVAAQQLAKATAERAFAELMLQKLQTASGVTVHSESPFPASPFRRH